MFKIITILFSVFLLTTNALRGNYVRSKRDFPLDALGLGSGAQETAGQTDQFIFDLLTPDRPTRRKSASQTTEKIPERKHRQDNASDEDYSSEELTARYQLKKQLEETKGELEILRGMLVDKKILLKTMEQVLYPSDAGKDWDVDYY